MVSRVLDSKDYVKEEARQKIESLIQENGYRPSAMVKSLTRSNMSMITVTMFNRLNPFFTNILDVIESWVGQQEYSIPFYNTPENGGREYKTIAQAIKHRVMGVLFLSVPDPDGRTEEPLTEAEDSGMPVVLIDRDLHNSDPDIILIGNKRVAYEGVELLVEPGYRKIGIVTCPGVMKKGKIRLDDYVRCLKDYDIEMEDEHIYSEDFDKESGYQAHENPLGPPDPLTAVLATCNSATLGCI